MNKKYQAKSERKSFDKPKLQNSAGFLVAQYL